MEKCLSVYISSLSTPPPPPLLLPEPSSTLRRELTGLQTSETLQKPDLDVNKWCKGQKCRMPMRLVAHFFLCCERTNMFHEGVLKSGAACNSKRNFSLKKLPSNALWCSGFVGDALWLNSFDLSSCQTYWRSLIPAGLMLTAELPCCFQSEEVRCRPFTKKGQWQKIKTLTSSTDMVTLPLMMGGAPRKSDLASKWSDLLTVLHMLDCHVNKMWNGSINASSCTFEEYNWLSQLPSCMQTSVSLIGPSVKLKSPQIPNK